MGLFKKKNTISINTSDGVHSLMGTEKGIEVHTDKVVLVNKKEPTLNKTIDFRTVKDISIVQSTSKQPGCLIFALKSGSTPIKFFYSHSQTETVNIIYKVTLQNFNAYKIMEKEKAQEQTDLVEINGIYSLMGSEDGIEVHSDKVVLVNKKIPVLSKKIEFRFLESIKIIPSSIRQQGSLEFEEKYRVLPIRFCYSHSQEDNIKVLYKIAMQNLEAYKTEQERIEQERKELLEEQERKRLQLIENQKKNNPDEYKRKALLCETIYKEYNQLLKQLKDEEDIYHKVSILKECYRKLDVINTTHHYNDCFRYMNEEMEKIEKKAKSAINSYIKEEKETGAGYIDIMQFADDLDFIVDWLSEKDLKL